MNNFMGNKNVCKTDPTMGQIKYGWNFIKTVTFRIEKFLVQEPSVDENQVVFSTGAENKV